MTRSNFGSVQYFSKGKYRIFWPDGYDADGLRIRRSRIVNGSRDDAERELAREMLAAGRAPACELTHRQAWDLVMPPKLAGYQATTRRNAEQSGRYLLAIVGDAPVGSIDGRLVSSVVESGMAPSVARNVVAYWRIMVAECMRLGIVDYPSNPISRKDLPAPKPKQRRLVDATEIAGWLDGISGFWGCLPLALCLGGGLRVEEAFGLRGEDMTSYSVGGKTYLLCMVSKAVVSVGGRTVVKDCPKNDSSRREVVVGEPFASWCIERAPASGWLCPSPKKGDEPRSTTYMTKKFKEYCERAGIPYVNPGKLRKSWSVMHAEAMSPDLLVCQAMGHTDGTMRGQAYSKTTRRAMMGLADNLERFISGLSGDVGTFGNTNYTGLSV